MTLNQFKGIINANLDAIGLPLLPQSKALPLMTLNQFKGIINANLDAIGLPLLPQSKALPSKCTLGTKVIPLSFG